MKKSLQFRQPFLGAAPLNRGPSSRSRRVRVTSERLPVLKESSVNFKGDHRLVLPWACLNFVALEVRPAWLVPVLEQREGASGNKVLQPAQAAITIS